jgi:hypothetical protein
MVLVGLIVAAALDAPALLADPPGEDESQRPPTRMEEQILIRARNALSRVPKAKPKNLFIKVHEGTVTITGEVSSPDMADQAERILKDVPGIYQVKNNLKVVADRQPLLVLPTGAEPPTRSESASYDPRTGKLGSLAGRVPIIPSSSSPDLLPKKRQELPANPFPPPSPDDSPRAPLKDNTPRGEGVVLGSPLPAPEPVHDLESMVRQVRQEDRRFRDLVIDVRDSQTIWVKDNPLQPDEVLALVDRLRRLPGVRSVVVKVGGS